ncbi:hypothetical protein A2Y99_03620 [Candidatus Gottesmanbacteria bacterium RBG_13_37_7]|uniref:Uncharacterized protein n=1 Tax=Candidatus Gottesmanbacteria bacterium RBG_13_37_7 TaxID=1798369 RepID=A0A1F5YJ03_9BACT|nr:MAG: hypothetical protein A2Y99_03620 [Candidatus Gottesmanbacteria bacterium RBG_13_37_7]
MPIEPDNFDELPWEQQRAYLLSIDFGEDPGEPPDPGKIIYCDKKPKVKKKVICPRNLRVGGCGACLKAVPFDITSPTDKGAIGITAARLHAGDAIKAYGRRDRGLRGVGGTRSFWPRR